MNLIEFYILNRVSDGKDIKYLPSLKEMNQK